jgi:hypothetical protein
MTRQEKRILSNWEALTAGFTPSFEPADAPFECRPAPSPRRAAPKSAAWRVRPARESAEERRRKLARMVPESIEIDTGSGS